MFKTFNMSIGMIMVMNPSEAQEVLEYLDGIGEKAYIIGSVIGKSNGVILCQK